MYICMCINKVYIYIYIYKTVCVWVCVSVCVCVYVYLHLSRCMSSSFNLIKKLHQKPSRGVVAKDRSNKLELLAYLHQAKNFILAGIFERSSQNPGVGLELMISIFNLKWIDEHLCSLFIFCLFICLFLCFCINFRKSKQMLET